MGRAWLRSFFVVLLLVGAASCLAFVPPPPAAVAPSLHRRAILRRALRPSPDNNDNDSSSSGGGGGRDDPIDLLSRRELLVPAVLSLGSGILLLSSEISDERAYDAKHKQIFASIADPSFRRILEIGIGDAANVPYYPRGATVVGIDPNLRPEAFAVAQAKAKTRGVTLIGQVASAEALPFADGSFDAVVSTLVFCTVPRPARALEEVARVLRPNGKFLFFEHVWGEEGTVLRAQQRALDPLQQLLAGGCHLTRETDRLFLAAAGGEEGGGEQRRPLPLSLRNNNNNGDGSGDAARGETGGAGEQQRQGSLFARTERFEYIRQSTKWPIVRQVAGVLVK